jgi:hypothetical protein
MKQVFAQFLPLLPLALVLMALGAAIGIITASRFASLVRAMQEKGYTLDHQSASDLLKVWSKRPERIVFDSDPEDLKALKSEHASVFGRRLRALKTASTICLIAVGGGALFILYQK